MNKIKQHKLYSYERYSQTKPDIQKISGIFIMIKSENPKIMFKNVNVFLKIGSNKIDLKTPGYSSFDKHNIDTYFFKTDITLGGLRKKRIELLQYNGNKKVKYHVNSIKIMIQFPDSPYLIYYKNWKNINWSSNNVRLQNNYSVILQHGE